jgi:hypothetical protein
MGYLVAGAPIKRLSTGRTQAGSAAGRDLLSAGKPLGSARDVSEPSMPRMQITWRHYARLDRTGWYSSALQEYERRPAAIVPPTRLIGLRRIERQDPCLRWIGISDAAGSPLSISSLFIRRW